MISIRKAATELERLEELNKAAVGCCSAAIGLTGKYAIELDPASVAQFRAQMQALAQRLREVSTERLSDVQNSFEERLSNYQRSGQEYIQHLRDDMAAAAAALEAFTGSITETGTDLEAGVKRELEKLNKVAACNDIGEIRSGIRVATASIAKSVQEMQATNQLSIAQLKDEIRLLHREIEVARSRPQAEPVAAQFDDQMEELIRRKSPFSVLLVRIRNVDGLLNCYSRVVVDSALNALEMRFRSTLPEVAITGRRGNDQFAGILLATSAGVVALSREVMSRLSGPVIERDETGAHTVEFDARAGVIEFRPESDPSNFHVKFRQLAEALASD